MSVSSARNKLIDEIKTLMGGELVDTYLGSDSLNLAVTIALDKYRQLSSNAVQEAYGFLEVQENVNEYTMPKDVVEIRKVFRRMFGMARGPSDGAGIIDPFDIAFTNLFLLQPGVPGGLTTFDAYSQFLETSGRLFGNEMLHVFDQKTRKLTLVRNPRAEKETMLVWMYINTPEEYLIEDVYAGPWLRDYATARAKVMMGEAFARFGSLPGPAGPIQLNGTELKNEGKEIMDKLEIDIQNYKSGETVLGWILG